MAQIDVHKCKDCDYSLKLEYGNPVSFTDANVFYGEDQLATGSPEPVYGPGAWEAKPLVLDFLQGEKMTWVVERHLARGAQPIDYYFQPYICPKCKAIESKFYFELDLDGEIYEPDYKCKACGRLLDKISVEEGPNPDLVSLVGSKGKTYKWTCPSCHGHRLEQAECTIFWD